jgi:hypothetical protein
MPIRDFADFETLKANLTLTPGVSAPGASWSPKPNYFGFLPEAYRRREIMNGIDLTFSFSRGKSDSVSISNTSGPIIMLPEAFQPGTLPIK